MEYLNWTQKKILWLTLIERYQRVTNMRLEYMNCTQEKFYVTLIDEYRKGDEYAYRIYELDTRKFLCHTDRKILKG